MSLAGAAREEMGQWVGRDALARRAGVWRSRATAGKDAPGELGRQLQRLGRGRGLQRDDVIQGHGECVAGAFGTSR